MCLPFVSLSGCPLAAAAKLNKSQDKQVNLQAAASEPSSNSDRVLRWDKIVTTISSPSDATCWFLFWTQFILNTYIYCLSTSVQG